MTGIFITGTDTGVGKTVIAALFALGLENACYWKPIQTGAGAVDGEPTDRERVAEMTGFHPERLLPEAYCLRLPASPHLAAAAESVAIDSERLRLPDSSGPLVVEGAGGVLVPLNSRHLMVDLMQWLGLPVVLVSSTRLGTINHTLLSLEALRRRGVAAAGVVLNGAPAPEIESALVAFGGARLLGRVPPLADFTPAALLPLGRALAQAL